jgi:hypothetical protein
MELYSCEYAAKKVNNKLLYCGGIGRFGSIFLWCWINQEEFHE